MVCGNHINSVFGNGLQQRRAIFCGFDRRIAFDEGTALCVVFGAEKQMMNTCFSGDAFLLKRAGLKQLHFFCRGQVQYMQLGTVFFGKPHG